MITDGEQGSLCDRTVTNDEQRHKISLPHAFIDVSMPASESTERASAR